MKTKMLLSAAAAALFTAETGFNFRVRVTDGVTSIKPSTRPRGVKGEFGFGKFDPATLAGEFGAGTLEGNFGLEAGKYGWYTVGAGEGIAFSQIAGEVEAPAEVAVAEPVIEAAAAVVEVPEAGGELVIDGNIDRVMMAGQHPAPVTIDEAVGILGITKDALRKRIARGSVRAALDEAGKVAGVFIDA